MSLLDKVHRILGAFDADHTELGLTEIAARSDVPKASAHRLCQRLADGGLLERTPRRTYQLGLRLFELGELVPRQRALRLAATPVMVDVMRSTGEMLHLGVRSGNRVLYIESVAANRHESTLAQLASTMPLHCTSTGKVLLAFSGDEVVDDVLGTRLERWTRHTVVHAGRTREELGRIRAQGYSVETEEARLGYVSVAAPLFGPDDEIAGAVSLSAPVFRADVGQLVRVITTAGAVITAEYCDPGRATPRLRSIG